jgi:hypothetical protein
MPVNVQSVGLFQGRFKIQIRPVIFRGIMRNEENIRPYPSDLPWTRGGGLIQPLERGGEGNDRYGRWGVAATIGVVGGVVGLHGGLTSFRDRFYKGQPVASLTTNNSGGRTLVQMRIKNTTEYDVVVNGGAERRGVYFLAEYFETGTIVRGQIKKVCSLRSFSSPEIAKS